MTEKNKYIDLQKYRNYSSIFSSITFKKILIDDDYSSINLKIIKFDNDKIGKKFSTYSEYIRFVYNELRKNYRNEYIYKNTFINEILLKEYGLKNTIAINEFRVGNSIADIVLFNGSSKVFEIKSELDSNQRLNNQLEDYQKIFQECYIVIQEEYINQYSFVNDSIGIIQLIKTPRSLKMKELKPAKKNSYIDPEVLINSLRTNEYKNIIRHHFGKLPEMNSFNMYNICKEYMHKIDQNSLHKLFIGQMKLRNSNTNILKEIYKEVRQVALAMNITESDYRKLYQKLDKIIRI